MNLTPTFLERFYEKLTGKPMEGEAPDELGLTRQVAKDLDKALMPHGSAVTRQVIIEANKAGWPPEYLQYIYFTLMESPESWPKMTPAQTGALNFAKELMTRAGKVPAYHSGLALPDGELEPLVNTILQRLALWAQSGLAALVMKSYQGVLKKNERATQRVVEGRLPPKKALVYLDTLFKRFIKTNPQWFANGDFLRRAFVHLLP